MSRKNRNSGSPPPHQEQRDRIVEDLDRNMLVEAAAGTGKTTRWWSAWSPCSPRGRAQSIRNLAAVTFTRKAAAELRARFQISLERAVRETEGTESAGACPGKHRAGLHRHDPLLLCPASPGTTGRGSCVHSAFQDTEDCLGLWLRGGWVQVAVCTGSSG